MSAVGVALGFDRADPIVGLAITLVILKITWDSWRTVRDAEPGDLESRAWTLTTRSRSGNSTSESST